MRKNWEELENIIEYSFADKSILMEALTHSSKGLVRSDGTRMDNERLEFIGDAMLDAIIGAVLYESITEGSEGALTKLRSQIVCEESLDIIGKSIGIGDFLDMGEGEEKTYGRNKPSVIADAVEALIGGIYLDGGYEKAKLFVERTFSDLINQAVEGKLFRDYKTKLQEISQKHGWHVCYEAMDEGPDHNKTFFVHLLINGKDSGFGTGKTKKEAEQKAAENFLEKGIKNVL